MKLYGESDAATIFFNFAHLATGIWDLKSQSQGGDQKNYCQEIWVYCIQMTAQNTHTHPKKHKS